MKEKIKKNLLEKWINVPAILNSHNLATSGEIQQGVREVDLRGFSRIIQTRRRGIPLQWLIEESHKHYSGYGSAFLDNKAQKKRKYNHLSSDSMIPNFWFVNVAGGEQCLLSY